MDRFDRRTWRTALDHPEILDDWYSAFANVHGEM